MQFRVISLLVAFAASISAIPTSDFSQPVPSQAEIDKHMNDVDGNGCRVLACAIALGIAPAACSAVFLEFGMNPFVDSGCVLSALASVVIVPDVCKHCVDDARAAVVGALPGSTPNSAMTSGND